LMWQRRAFVVVLVACLLAGALSADSKGLLNEAISAAISELIREGVWQEIYQTFFHSSPPTSCLSREWPALDGYLKSVLSRGILHFGYVDKPPYASQVPPIGVDVTLSRAIALKIGAQYNRTLKADFVHVPVYYGYASDLALKLNVGQMDVALGMSESEQKYVQLSCDYFQTVLAALVSPQTVERGLISLPAIKAVQRTVRIGSLKSSNAIGYIKTLLPNSFYYEYSTSEAMFGEVASGRLDIAVDDRTTLRVLLTTEKCDGCQIIDINQKEAAVSYSFATARVCDTAC